MFSGAFCAGLGGGEKLCAFERGGEAGRFGFVGGVNGFEKGGGDLGVAEVGGMATIGERGGVDISRWKTIGPGQLKDREAGLFLGAFGGAGEENSRYSSGGEFVENPLDGWV